MSSRALPVGDEPKQSPQRLKFAFSKLKQTAPKTAPEIDDEHSAGGEEAQPLESPAKLNNLFCSVDENGSPIKGPNFYTIYPDRTDVIPVVGFIGAVGAGKSTLLRGLCSEDIPTPATHFPIEHDNGESSSASEIHSFECTFGTFKAVALEGDVQCGRLKEVVSKVYPKFLYSFSNVIVYVLKEAQKVGDVIEELLGYAKSAAAGSVNAPNFPSLVIVFNKYNGVCKPNFKTSSEDFIDSAGTTAVDELRQYYHDLNAVYVPVVSNEKDEENAKIFNRQRDALSSAITGGLHSSWVRSTRPASRSEQFDLMATALKRLGDDPNATLDHVSLTLVQRQTHGKSEIDVFLKDYFDSLYMMYKDDRKSPHEAWKLCSELMKQVVFSVYLSWCWRSSGGKFPSVGAGASVDEHFAPFLKSLSDHINDQAPCQAKHTFPYPANEVQCETVRKLHIQTKGGAHKSSKSYDVKKKNGLGWWWWWGNPKSYPQSCSWTTANNSPFEAPEIVDLQRHLESTMRQRDGPIAGSDFKQIQQEHHDQQRGIIAKYLRMGEPARQCVSCLQHFPTEVLSCGHNFCSYCLSERPGDPCIICTPYPLQIPKLAGLRVASFDGGGVRGIVIASAMQKLEDLCYGIPTHDLFDLVVGTSTGGIIALALAKKHMKTDEIRTMYNTLAKGVFKYIPGLNDVARIIRGYKYGSGPLERELNAVFGEERLFISVPRVAVTTCTPDSGSLKLCIMSSFVRPEKEGYPTILPYYRLTSAARATSAAGSYLPTFQDYKGQEFTDGGMLSNNPCEVALDEASLLWPDQPRDVLLSFGTGEFRQETKPLHNSIIAFLGAAVDIAVNTTEAWNSVNSEPHKSDSRFRVNPVLSKEYDLDDADQMEAMEMDAKNDLDGDSLSFKSLVEASHKLIKSLFFLSEAIIETVDDESLRIKLCIAPRVSLPNGLLEQCPTGGDIFKLEPRLGGESNEVAKYSFVSGRPVHSDPSRPTWTTDFRVSRRTTSISIKCHVGGKEHSFNKVDHISGSPFVLRLLNDHPDLVPHRQCPHCVDV